MSGTNSFSEVISNCSSLRKKCKQIAPQYHHLTLSVWLHMQFSLHLYINTTTSTVQLFFLKICFPCIYYNCITPLKEGLTALVQENSKFLDRLTSVSVKIRNFINVREFMLAPMFYQRHSKLGGCGGMLHLKSLKFSVSGMPFLTIFERRFNK